MPFLVLWFRFAISKIEKADSKDGKQILQGTDKSTVSASRSSRRFTRRYDHAEQEETQTVAYPKVFHSVS